MEYIECDLLVIGGGAAGARAAYEAKRLASSLRVLLVVSGEYATGGSTNLFASESLGINAPFNFMGDGDSSDVFFEDMVKTGGGISDPRLCRIIADEACERVGELIALGLKFDEQEGKPIQRKLSGCTKARSLTCGGHTGREITRVFGNELRKLGVNIVPYVRILKLLQDGRGCITGAWGLFRGKSLGIAAKAVILASGGAGAIFRYHVNPPSQEGDGWCMAYETGARLVNMEFFQVGPGLFHPSLKFIIHGPMWRLKPRLTNVLKEEFLRYYCPPSVSPEEVIELKAMSYPFSVRTEAKYLDIALYKEVTAGRVGKEGGIFFDITHVDKDKIVSLSPITYARLKKVGLDLTKDRIEIGPVVQNFNGGIMIDTEGFTGVEGLFAAGEITGGVHGADRPGGNNLIDTQVFGYRAGRAAARYVLGREGFETPKFPGEEEILKVSDEDEPLMAELASLYYRYLTIVRSREGLHKVLDFIDAKKGASNSLPLKNRMLLGKIFARAMLVREESRGTHFREDFPAANPKWLKRVIIKAPGDGGGDEPEVILERAFGLESKENL